MRCLFTYLHVFNVFICSDIIMFFMFIHMCVCVCMQVHVCT